MDTRKGSPASVSLGVSERVPCTEAVEPGEGLHSSLPPSSGPTRSCQHLASFTKHLLCPERDRLELTETQTLRPGLEWNAELRKRHVHVQLVCLGCSAVAPRCP